MTVGLREKAVNEAIDGQLRTARCATAKLRLMALRL
jgi:hypothetical protein